MNPPSSKRYVLYPIENDSVWTMYKRAKACFWTFEEIDLSKDRADWRRLTPAEQHFMKNTLAFFAISDGIVNENLCLRFINDVQMPEAKCFYGFQIFMEQIHAETYSGLLDFYIEDRDEKQRLFQGLETIPVIRRKGEFCFRWIEDKVHDLATRLIAFACVEGIFFASSFCSFYWLKKRGLCPGATFANELIARDESMHAEFGVMLYHLLKNPDVDYSRIIREIVRESVELEKEFVRDSLQSNLIGMNQDLMCQYVEFMGDRLLLQLGEEKMYRVSNPFDFMELISMANKTNFFESRVSQYSRAGVSDSLNKQGKEGGKDTSFVVSDEF